MTLLNYSAEEFHRGFEEEIRFSQSVIRAAHPETSCFTCPICLGIARYPIEVRCCRHYYCCSCFIKYFQDPASQPTARSKTDFKCAICRSVISAKFDSTRKPLIHRLIPYHNIIVMCPFDCGKSGVIFQILIHERVYCPKRPLRCPCPGCTDIIPASEIINHISFCPNYSIFCPKCGLNIKVGEARNHDCIQALTKIIIEKIPAGEIYCVLGSTGQPVTGPQILENKNEEDIKIYDENFGELRNNKATIRRQENNRFGQYRFVRSDIQAQGAFPNSGFASNDNPRLWRISSTSFAEDRFGSFSEETRLWASSSTWEDDRPPEQNSEPVCNLFFSHLFSH